MYTHNSHAHAVFLYFYTQKALKPLILLQVSIYLVGITPPLEYPKKGTYCPKKGQFSILNRVFFSLNRISNSCILCCLW